MKYKVVEKFVSINGEGRRAGELAVFIRFQGCNLNCSYCDTKWANEPACEYTEMTGEEILAYIHETGVRNITLTGGEPLLREGMKELINAVLEDPFYRVEIETNGSVDLAPYTGGSHRPVFTMDYKVPGSGMESFMRRENFSLLTEEDTVKFVVSSREDLECAEKIVREYDLAGRVPVFFSPVFGKIEPVDLVNYIAEKKLNDVKVQIQLHKVIWDPDKRGV